MKVFVAHPYTLTELPLDDYRSKFKEIEKEFPGIKFTYADEKIETVHILEKIERMIIESDFSLFDITSWNSNVSLELGIAIGLKREYYILFNPNISANDVPSDLKGLGRLQYNSLSNLYSQLTVLIQEKIKSKGFDAQAQVNDIKLKILECLTANGKMNIGKIAEKLSVSKPIIKAGLGELLSSNQIASEGQKKATKYFVPQQLNS
jgi:hypothetical protein